MKVIVIPDVANPHYPTCRQADIPALGAMWDLLGGHSIESVSLRDEVRPAWMYVRGDGMYAALGARPLPVNPIATRLSVAELVHGTAVVVGTGPVGLPARRRAVPQWIEINLRDLIRAEVAA